MFKMMFLVFVIACLYIMWGEAKKVYMRKKAEDDLVEAETESEVLSMMERTKEIEKDNDKRMEALYSTEETKEEVESN
jgi:hypothetical protein